MILKQQLVPKYIKTITFVFHILEQIRWADGDWGAIVFAS